MARHVSVAEGRRRRSPQVREVVGGGVENGMGTWPRWIAHLTQTTAGWTPSRRAMPTMTGSSTSTVSSGVRSRSGRAGEPIGREPDRDHARSRARTRTAPAAGNGDGAPSHWRRAGYAHRGAPAAVSEWSCSTCRCAARDHGRRASRSPPRRHEPLVDVWLGVRIAGADVARPADGCSGTASGRGRGPGGRAGGRAATARREA